MGWVYCDIFWYWKSSSEWKGLPVVPDEATTHTNHLSVILLPTAVRFGFDLDVICTAVAHNFSSFIITMLCRYHYCTAYFSAE
jgi:hypothetical protein